MIGQQYFADGTGIAYFNDGTREPFNHTLTEDEGYYYDDLTTFYLDAVPEVGNNTISVVCGDIEAKRKQDEQPQQTPLESCHHQLMIITVPLEAAALLPSP